jgi:hypothetical protein
MKVATASKQQSRDIIAKALTSGRPTTGADVISTRSVDRAPRSRAIAGFCIGAAIDIGDALIAKTYTKTSMDDAAWTILTAVYPGAVPTLSGLIQSSGEGSTVAYPFLAPPSSLSQFTKVVDVGIELTVAPLVSQAVAAIGKAMLSSHPQFVQCLELVAGVVSVNLVKKEAHICFDWYTRRTGDQGQPPEVAGKVF